MSNASSNWLELPLTPPRSLLPVLLALAMLALVAIRISAVPPWLMLMPVIVVGLLMYRLLCWPRGLLRFRDDGEIVRVDDDRREFGLRLLGAGARGPLRVLRLDDGERRFSAIYCRPGNLDTAQARRLTLWLRRHGSGEDRVDDTVAAP